MGSQNKMAENKWLHTPWKINMEPKNGGWEDDFPVKIFVMLGFQ